MTHSPDWLLAGTPRPVQMEAMRRSYPKPGWGHFLDTRLGKSFVALNEFMLFRRDFGFRWLVILAPSQFCGDWVRFADIAKIDVPAHRLVSSKRAEAEQFIRKNRNGAMVVVNFEALGSAQTMELLLSICGPETLFAVDESICVKNPQSMWFKKALELSKNCGARRVLTGKPSTQGPQDYWGQLRVIGQLSGFSYFAFRNTFCNMGGYMGKQVLKGEKGIKNKEKLQETLDSCSWSARKIDWLTDYEEPDYAERQLDMIHEQRSIYKAMHDEFLVELQNGTIITADQTVTKLGKLQQITSGFILDEFGKAHDIMPLVSNPKVQAIKRMLDEEISDKLLVIVRHTHSLNMLMEALKEFMPTFIKGGMGDASIQEQKDQFNLGPSRVLIGIDKATKYGHNMMGNQVEPCTTIAYFENSYSLDDRAQTEARAQGEGQLCKTTIWDFIASPMDMAAIEALRLKEDVAAAIGRYSRDSGILPRQQA